MGGVRGKASGQQGGGKHRQRFQNSGITQIKADLRRGALPPCPCLERADPPSRMRPPIALHIAVRGVGLRNQALRHSGALAHIGGGQHLCRRHQIAHQHAAHGLNRDRNATHRPQTKGI